MRLSFEWDANKDRANFKKHKIKFEVAKTIFNDPLLITFKDEDHSTSEDRFISIGLSSSRRLLLVVHVEHETKQDEVLIRIISCRRATRSERRTYEESEA